jgi:hypothetical protein
MGDLEKNKLELEKEQNNKEIDTSNNELCNRTGIFN